MLDLGANINSIDINGNFALKYALLNKNIPELEKLIERCADINLIDFKGRNLLHHAIN